MAIDYTQEELGIIDYIETQNPKSSVDAKNKIKRIKQAVKNKVLKRKAISLRILEDDLRKIKKKL